MKSGHGELLLITQGFSIMYLCDIGEIECIVTCHLKWTADLFESAEMTTISMLVKACDRTYTVTIVLSTNDMYITINLHKTPVNAE